MSKTLIGPKKKPEMKTGDFHLVVNDDNETIKCYDHTGKFLWKKSAMAKGVSGSSTWITGGDTPPGLYKLGTLFVSKAWESLRRVWYPYGKHCWDMVELENQENVRGRAGICLHGGGSAAPDPLADYQPLTKTHGCVRMHNKTLEEFVLPLTHKKSWGRLVRRNNTVFLSVYQDRD